MSWIQWQGETLPTTDDDLDLTLYLAAADSLGPVQTWGLDLQHRIRRFPPPSEDHRAKRVLSVELRDLGLQVQDWRELAGLTLRPTREFLEQRQGCDALGQVQDVSLHVTELLAPEPDEPHYPHPQTWDYRTLDYELRLGQWDGICLPCELDAWLLPEEDYWRTEPETEAELAQVPQGPPNLRLMARAVFSDALVEMPYCGAEPAPQALMRLEQHIGRVRVRMMELKWKKHYTLKVGAKVAPTPGVRSTVRMIL